MNNSFYFCCLATGTFVRFNLSDHAHLFLLNITNLHEEKIYMLYSFLRQQYFQLQINFHNKNNQIIKRMQLQISVKFYPLNQLFSMQKLQIL